LDNQVRILQHDGKPLSKRIETWPSNRACLGKHVNTFEHWSLHRGRRLTMFPERCCFTDSYWFTF